MPTNSSLMQGPQNLFGAKASLQFGKLNATVVMANQRGSMEEIVISGGAGGPGKEFEIRADEYEDYKHFFLSQYFKEHYEKTLSQLPLLATNIVVTRVDVYVTNRTNNTEDLRSIVGFADLGENNPYQIQREGTNAALLPVNSNVDTASDNNTNSLYSSLNANSGVRNAEITSDILLSAPFSMKKGEDYELIRSARKLEQDKDFILNPRLGYISLTTPLRSNDVLAVSFEYTVNGNVYKVGELLEDFPNDSTSLNSSVLMTKLIKVSSIRTDLPVWDLQMRNVYNLKSTRVSRKNFQLRVIYRDDRSGVDNPFLHEGNPNVKDVPLVEIMGLDQLTPLNETGSDGNFDFLPGLTIDTLNGRIFFPVLEPFGAHLKEQFDEATEGNLISKYVFNELYDNTKSDVLNLASKK